MLNRSLEKFLKKYLKEKILLIVGPRQCGKTTLSLRIRKDYEYLNYDNEEDRDIIDKKQWVQNKKYLIFDELHKKENWKRWLKGVYDTKTKSSGIIVTGSARLDIYHKMGDSLAGRFFQFRLHPFDVKEIYQFNKKSDPDQTLNRLLKVGGFPEPYLKNTTSYYIMWKRSHLDIIFKQDLIELETPRKFKKIELLVQLLKKSIGTPVSYKSLADHLNCDPKSIELWLQWLENLFVVFKVPPYHRNLTDALKKKSKYYFYDTAQLYEEKGQRLENLVACSLLKENQFQEDCLGQEKGLFFIQNNNKKEIDFLVTKNEEPSIMIEVKSKGENLSSNFQTFSPYFKNIQKVQIVKDLRKERDFADGTQLRRASEWLSRMPI